MSLKCVVFWIVLVVVASEITERPEAATPEAAIELRESKDVGRMVEEGRTLVHHAMKRFMIILPAIFFKLGIAFAMLVLVTVVSVNNGFIGFLLLVVGLSSVLARLQEPRKPAVAPYVSPVAFYQSRLARDWDRRDAVVGEGTTKKSFAEDYEQRYVYPQIGSYNPAYYVQKV